MESERVDLHLLLVIANSGMMRYATRRGWRTALRASFGQHTSLDCGGQSQCLRMPRDLQHELRGVESVSCCCWSAVGCGRLWYISLISGLTPDDSWRDETLLGSGRDERGLVAA